MIIPFKKTEITPCSLAQVAPSCSMMDNNIDPSSILEAKEVSNGWLLRDIYHQQFWVNHETFNTFEQQIDNNAIYRANKNIKDLYDEYTEYGWFSFFPLSIELDITNKCNFNCIHCNRSAGSERSEELSFSTIKSIAKEVQSLGIKRIQLLGGEPTIHPAFFDICELFKECGADNMFTSTNGWKVTDKIQDLLCSAFSSVQVSLHSVTKATHDYITNRRGSWDHAVNTIKTLVGHHVEVIISMSVMGYNIHEMNKMAELAASLGVQTIRFLALQEVGRGLELNPLSQKQFYDAASIIDNLRKLCPELKILSAGFPTSPQNAQVCYLWGCAAGRTLMAIHANGEVSCCSIVKKKVGSIYNNSLFEIWHNDYFKTLRKIENSKCLFATRCGGKCRYKNENPYVTKC